MAGGCPMGFRTVIFFSCARDDSENEVKIIKNAANQIHRKFFMHPRFLGEKAPLNLPTLTKMNAYTKGKQ
jgi:hypothetical protein